MTRMDEMALKHVAESLRYERSEQAQLDRLCDLQKRAQADIKAGHLPACSLTRCAPGCKRG